ncbi:MAG TPA: hypothetical protein DEV87_04630 [Clostridiales bacterium]|nr:hypothetical protein [Clostridiales bacterium]
MTENASVKKRNNAVSDKSLTILRNVTRVFLVIWVILVLFPLVWTIVSSLKTEGEFYASAWSLPKSLKWENFRVAWEEMNFAKYFLNSVILSVGTVALTVIMTTTTSYCVAKFVSPATSFLSKFYSLFMMVPQLLLLIPLLKFCESLNLVDGGIVLFTLMITNALQGVPFYVFMTTPFMRGINNAVLEAAEIDGANQFQTFFRIVLPMVMPAVFVVTLLSFVGIWNEYVMSITFITYQEEFYTVSVGLNNLLTDNTYVDVEKFAAIVISMIPIFIVYGIFQKPLQNGLSSADGVKG